MATVPASPMHAADTPLGDLLQSRPSARFTLLQKFSLLSFLCVLGITVAVCATGAAFLRERLIQHDAAVVGDLVDALLTRSLPASYLESALDAETAPYEGAFAGIVSSARIVRLILYDRTGRILWSDERALIGTRVEQNRELQAAARGKVQVNVVRPRKEEHRALRAYDWLEEIYLPVRYHDDGRVLAVLEIYREPPLVLLDRLLMLVWVLGGGGGLALYLMLFAIVRRSSRRQAGLERELTAHARTLEKRVGERTAELVAKTREVSTLYETMRATKEYLENLIASSVDGIVTVDGRGRVTFVSQGAQRMFGCREEQVLGTPTVRYWARGRSDLRAFRRRLAATGRLQNCETDLRAPDGRVVPVHISASVLRDADGRVGWVLAVVRDITDLRRMQRQMVSAERLAAAGLLAAGVAHEVGNPLACISSLSEVLRARAGDPGIQRGLDDIEIHAGRIEKIVQELTQLTRPASSEFRRCSIEEIVRSAIQLVRHNPAARRIGVAARVAPDLPAVRAAPDQLLQVFLNLVLNAADAGGDLTITAVAEDGELHVTFADTGRGMSHDELRKLFDPFYSTKEKEKHMGLGLFVSHEIVRQHGGSIVAESAPGSGSTFTVRLPVEPAGERGDDEAIRAGGGRRGDDPGDAPVAARAGGLPRRHGR